ncbi:hypothetical protein CC78DRAFT_577113 [Lojkania enalia]|uniref:Uncharacterized protein n=1 Tax=Lojkania enalia TaxID=147567 RepID=A0A9P4KDV1_9PLEO|nr:hypothetical protein CC78DRAFT_577113 [Didymosphaeria enalia]
MPCTPSSCPSATQKSGYTGRSPRRVPPSAHASAQPHLLRTPLFLHDAMHSTPMSLMHGGACNWPQLFCNLQAYQPLSNGPLPQFQQLDYEAPTEPGRPPTRSRDPIISVLARLKHCRSAFEAHHSVQQAISGKANGHLRKAADFTNLRLRL